MENQLKIIRYLGPLFSFLSIALCPFLQWGCTSFDTGNETVKTSVRFEGVEAPEIVDELKQVANFPAFNRVPRTKFLLQQRAQQYVPDLTGILASHGYYAADIDVDIRQDNKDDLELIYDVDTGPLYSVGKIELQFEKINPDDHDSLQRPDPAQLGIRKDDVATAETIRSAADKLKSSLRKQGFAFADTDQPTVTINHDQRTVRVELTAEAGPLTHFGETQIKGLKTVDEALVRGKLPWQPGTTYDPAKVRNLRQRLVKTQLFSIVRVQRATQTPQAELPMRIELTEADHRSVSAGIGYATDRGLGVRTSWEHRNLQGRGQRLRLALEVSRRLQELTAKYRRPWFLREDQSLLLDGLVKREDSDAYEGTSAIISGRVERRLSPNITIAGGPAITGTHVVEEQTEDFALLSLPVTLEWDRRNDVLNPTEGWRLSAAYTPFKEVISGDLLFHKSVVSTYWYTELLPSLVFALRSKVGVIWGEETNDIPATERFYTGGGGSIRGYPYQDIGPRREGEPAGGRSIAEVSTELRWRSSEKIGWAVFLDGGNVYNGGFTEMDGELAWSSGVGMRYYTPVGPLRLDIGFPLSEREHVDDNFQIYISLGQAF